MLAIGLVWIIKPALGISNGVIDRESWVVEQWTRGPAPTQPGESRSQVNANLVDQADSVSAQGTGIIDLGPLEVVVRASQRIFPEWTDASRGLNSVLVWPGTVGTETLGAGIARYYVAPDGHYGRVGAEWLHAFPGGNDWVKLNFSGGLMPFKEPWFLNVDVAFFLSTEGAGNFLSIRGSTGKHFTLSDGKAWELGAFLWWTSRNRSLATPGTYEHMLFSLGPSVAYLGSWGELRAEGMVRMWLDANVPIPVPGQPKTIGFPSAFEPALSLSWTYHF